MAAMWFRPALADESAAAGIECGGNTAHVAGTAHQQHAGIEATGGFANDFGSEPGTEFEVGHQHVDFQLISSCFEVGEVRVCPDDFDEVARCQTERNAFEEQGMVIQDANEKRFHPSCLADEFSPRRSMEIRVSPGNDDCHA